LIRGHLAEGRDWLERILARSDRATPTAALADALSGAGRLAEAQSDYDRARELHEAALAAGRALGDPLLIGESLNNLANVAHDLGDYGRATTLHEQALATAREIGHPRSIGKSLANLGVLALYQGHYDLAEQRFNEATESMRDSGDVHSLCILLNNLGVVATRRGDYARAIALNEESLELRRGLGDQQGTASALTNIADAHLRSGRTAPARPLLEEALRISEEIGDLRNLGVVLYNLADADRQDGKLTEAAAMLRRSMEVFQQVGDKLAITEVVLSIALLADPRTDAERGATLIGAAEASLEAIGAPNPIPPDERERQIVALRKALGEDGLAQAIAAGRQMSLEEGAAAAARLKTVATAPPAVVSRAPGRPSGSDSLTTREHEVLRLLVQGRSNAEIGEALFISPRTAGTHVTNILAKLDVDTRAAAVAYAFQNGLV
jgi:ATP/maltotriose-dependent transcriptional regulator MalT